MLSVNVVTVNVPEPGVSDETVTVQVPATSVVHGLGVAGAPAPVQVNAIEAPAAGVDAAPSSTVAVITKSCGSPTKLVASGETVTV